MSVISAVVDEMGAADSKYGQFRSSHEGLGVLTEEYMELILAIQANRKHPIITEAIQVAAVACRIAESMENEATIRRSGCTPSS